MTEPLGVLNRMLQPGVATTWVLSTLPIAYRSQLWNALNVAVTKGWVSAAVTFDVPEAFTGHQSTDNVGGHGPGDHTDIPPPIPTPAVHDIADLPNTVTITNLLNETVQQIGVNLAPLETFTIDLQNTSRAYAAQIWNGLFAAVAAGIISAPAVTFEVWNLFTGQQGKEDEGGQGQGELAYDQAQAVSRHRRIYGGVDDNRLAYPTDLRQYHG
jgi:hypothetical protein